MDITLTEVSAMDQISIRTQFSEYHFCVTDPRLCRGFLSGGLLGNRRQEAFLAGVYLSAGDWSMDSRKLETGRRAVFCVAGKSGLESLTTSVITQLAFAKTGNANTA